jgi:quinol monooxygenase YgiN
MAFIQIIECHTDRVEEMIALENEWQQATEGRHTLRRAIVARDRKDPKRHLMLAFFDSYESAMVNSDLPETSAFGEKQQALLDAPMSFTDLDVLEDRQVGA